MARLLEVEFSKWTSAPCLRPRDLQQAGMEPRYQRCCDCGRGNEQVERYVALKRTAPLQATPLPASALRLLCLDCYTDLTASTSLPLTEEAVEEWVDVTMMGAMETCMQLMAMAKVQWGGQHGSGELY